MDNLKAFTSNFINLTDDELNSLKSLFKPVVVKKQDHILTTGTYVKDLYFINNGIFRIYYIKDGEEFTTKFLIGPNIYAELFSIRKASPTFLNMQAISESDCYKANFYELEKLIEKNLNLKKLFVLLYESLFISGGNRQISFIYDSQTERYLKLMDELPDIINEIPLQYIASYLGIRPETLSRIRKKIENNKK